MVVQLFVFTDIDGFTLLPLVKIDIQRYLFQGVDGDVDRVAFVSSTNSIAFWIDRFNEYHNIPLAEVERLTIE